MAIAQFKIQNYVVKRVNKLTKQLCEVSKRSDLTRANTKIFHQEIYNENLWLAGSS